MRFVTLVEAVVYEYQSHPYNHSSSVHAAMILIYCDNVKEMYLCMRIINLFRILTMLYAGYPQGHPMRFYKIIFVITAFHSWLVCSQMGYIHAN